MIYKKPIDDTSRLRAFYDRGDAWDDCNKQILQFLDSLPAEFEIVQPGMTQVRWPEGVTRSELDGWCDDLTRYVPENADILRYLRQLAAIAPVEKKKRTISVWESGGHLIAVRDNPNLDSQVVVGWRKVGECEVSE